VESPKFYVIDSNWPQHHAVSVQHNRAGEHWGSTITELVAASLSHRLAIGVLRVTVAATSERENNEAAAELTGCITSTTLAARPSPGGFFLPPAFA
jgi:hypothetical protein